MINRPNSSFADYVIKKLNTKIIGKNIYHFKTIDSTNLFSKKLIKDGVEEGTVVISDVQLSGRGRKNRTWSSPEGGLWFSVILYPNLHPKDGMLLTMTSSVSIAQGIKEKTGLKSIIKWPNDLLIKDKKVCGILTEIDAEQDKIKYAIVGIGINVNNELEKDLKKTATTLKKEIGTIIKKEELFIAILKNFDENYNKLFSKGADFIRNLWLAHSNIIGKKIKVKNDGSVIIGKVKNVDNTGCIILETRDGIITIDNGDVEYL